MNRQTYWGLGVLIILLIAAGGFMYWQWSSVQQLKEQLAQDEKLLVEKEKPVAENNLPPAELGKKWVPHGDHFHQVPIDAPDMGQEVPITQPSVQPIQTDAQAKAYPHQKLLDTHPVEALRQLTTEKGHWSAEFIPPFPPEDREAAELARAVYIQAHHWTTVTHPEDSHDHTHSAEYEQAEQLIQAHRKARREWTNAKNKARWEGRYKEFYNPDDLARWNDLGSLLLVGTLSNRPPLVPLSEMRTWSSMFNDIRY